MDPEIVPKGGEDVSSCDPGTGAIHGLKEPQTRRPRTFHKTFTRRLENAGISATERTSDSNLKYLISRLSAELEHQRAMANHYQQKLVELKKVEKEKRRPLKRIEDEKARVEGPCLWFLTDSGGRKPNRHSPTLVHPSKLYIPTEAVRLDQEGEGAAESHQNPLVTWRNFLIAFPHLPVYLDAQLLAHLNRIANPSLSLVTIGVPNLTSIVPDRLVGETTFYAVLTAFDFMSVPFGSEPIQSTTAWANILNIKADFKEQKARRVWNDIFEPINSHPSNLLIGYGPNSRRESDCFEECDPDMDHMDRKLMKMSDRELVASLQYCALLMGGMEFISSSNDDLSIAREHLMRHCERMLKEATFKRDLLSSNSSLALSLLDSLLLISSLFATYGVSTLVLSLLAYSWQLASQHREKVHPGFRGALSCLNALLSPTPSSRSNWMKISLDNLKETPKRYFQLTTMTYISACYHSILLRDEDSLLVFLPLIEEMVSSGGEEEEGEKEKEEEGEHFQHHNQRDQEEEFSASPRTTTWCNLQQNSSLGYTEKMTATGAVDEAISSMEKELLESDFFYNDPEGCMEPWDFSLLHSVTSDGEEEEEEEDCHGKEKEGFLHQHHHSSSSSPSSSSSSPSQPPSLLLSHPPSSSSSPPPLKRYAPPEQLKCVLRVSVQLVRAEAALCFGNEDSCRHWVDEAERTLRSILQRFASQRVFLLKHLFKATCTFPTGTRTVCEEFERRIIEIEGEKRRSHPFRCGTMWSLKRKEEEAQTPQERSS